MKKPQRDPRIEPRPGDVLVKHGRKRYVSIVGKKVWFAHKLGGALAASCVSLKQWREWAKDASICG